MRPTRRGVVAFTLIELLIVVAIIAILAAIAVPNFLEAQVRSKVSRVYSDHLTLALGLLCFAFLCLGAETSQFFLLCLAGFCFAQDATQI